MAATENLNLSTLLDTLEDGKLRVDLEKALAEIIVALNQKVTDHGGTATAGLAIALKFKLDHGAVEVDADFRAKLPEQARHRTILWTTADNKLTKANPRQQQLPFRDVNKETPFANSGEDDETVVA